MSIDYNINLTENAIKKIRSIVSKEKNKNSVLRVAVSGGGCSGFRYSFLIDQISNNLPLNNCANQCNNKFDNNESTKHSGSPSSYNKISQDLIIRDKNGDPILMLDNCSASFLINAVIDYVEDLNGSRFQIKNTLAKSQCGCGNSFSI